MKKLFLLSIILFSSFQLSAQEIKFGLTGGYLNVDVTASFEEINSSVNESWYYIGALADIALNQSFHLKPGVNYGNIEDSGILYIPIVAKYYIATSGFHLQAGPQASIILEESGEEMNSFGLDIGFGAGYDITQNFFIEARYALELTNRITDAGQQAIGADVAARINSLNVGLGYKF